MIAGAFGLKAKAQIVIGTNSKIQFGADLVSSSSQFTAKAGSTINFGGPTNLNQLESNGTISLSASVSNDNRRRLDTGTIKAGKLLIGDGGLKSMGHMIVPAGGSLTFNSTSAASIIAGKGLDNHGAVSVLNGEIDVQAGGVRSNSEGSSIAVDKGKLDFSSAEPSLIGGKGITIASIATVSVNKGMVGITGKTEGKMKVSSDASVILSASSKAECANFVGGGCKDKVEVVTLAADGKLISGTAEEVARELGEDQPTNTTTTKPKKVSSGAHASASGLLLLFTAAALW